MSQIKFTTDSFAETKLKDFGLDFKIAEIDFDAIDFDDSAMNNARMIEPISEELTQEYALAMERGDVFPMPVILSRKGKKALIVSGNHRVPAAKIVDGKGRFNCYLVTSDDPIAIDLLPRVVNRGHGRRQEREEAVLHALHAVDAFNFKSAQAEKMFGLRVGVVTEELKSRDMRKKLNEKGIKADKIAKAVVNRLDGLKNDNVAVAAARIIEQSKMPTTEAFEFCTLIKDNRTEASQMAVVADYEKRVGTPAPAVTKHERNVRTKFLMCLTTMENQINGKRNLTQLQITDKQEQVDVKKRCGDIAERLRSVCGNKTTGK